METEKLNKALQDARNQWRAMQTTGMFDDLTDEETYNQHARILNDCACQLLYRQGKIYEIDDNNRDALRFLLFYFNQCQRALDPIEYKNEKFKNIVDSYTLDKNVMLCGGVGTGKTLMMDAFALYLKRTGNPMAYECTSVTEMLNYYKVNDHLDYYTYNVGRDSYEGNPKAFCLNDVGLQTQRYFGNDLQIIIDEYFHARNEIWTQHGIRSHLTTNLGRKQMQELFDDPYGRLADRFKTFNIIPLGGESRR